MPVVTKGGVVWTSLWAECPRQHNPRSLGLQPSGKAAAELWQQQQSASEDVIIQHTCILALWHWLTDHSLLLGNVHAVTACLLACAAYRACASLRTGSTSCGGGTART